MFYNFRNNATKSRFDFNKDDENAIKFDTVDTESLICDDLLVILYFY